MTPSPPQSAECLSRSSGLGYRKSARNGHGQETLHLGSAGSPRHYPPDRYKAGGFLRQSLVRADAFSRSWHSKSRLSPSHHYRRSYNHGLQPCQCRQSPRLQGSHHHKARVLQKVQFPENQTPHPANRQHGHAAVIFRAQYAVLLTVQARLPSWSWPLPLSGQDALETHLGFWPHLRLPR